MAETSDRPSPAERPPGRRRAPSGILAADGAVTHRPLVAHTTGAAIAVNLAPVDVVEEPVSSLAAYASVAIAFRVTSRLRLVLTAGGLGGMAWREEAVTPYVKDYDALTGPPNTWPAKWDLAGCGILAAYVGDARVGGALVVPAGSGHALALPGDRAGAALLHDLRVRPELRGRGVGARLYAAAAAWARKRGWTRLDVETQDVNVAACRFYARQGCRLVAFDRYAYARALDEVQLIWAMDL